MVIYLLPNTVVAETIASIGNATDRFGEPRGRSDNICELESLREESVKHFRLEDGSCIAVQYSNPVHTLDDNGKWQDIDNTLSSSGSEFSTGNARVKFAKKITGNESLFTLHDGNGKITLSLDGAKKKTAGKVTNTSTEFDKDATKLTKLTTLDKLSAKILYADILDDVDIEYIAESLNIKENIIVKKASDSYSYTFTLKLNNLTAEQRADGSIVISSPTDGRTVYRIPKGYMFDADGKRSSAVSYTLSQIGNGRYSLCVTADSEWINAEGRAFPVTIDPTINAGTDNITYITVASDYEGNHNAMYSGYFRGDEDGHNRLLIKKNNISASALPVGSVITDAKLTLSIADLTSSDNYAVREMLGQWNENSVWATVAASYYSSVITDFKEISDYRDVTWNITSIARKWYEGQPNNGISIYPVTEGTVDNHVTFILPTNMPFISVTYINDKGVEDYYTYSSFGVGLGGASYINDFSGNLVHILGTTSTTDSLMPYMPSLVYNANMSGKFFTSSDAITPVTVASAAYGFKLSTQETISSKVIDGVQYYVWSDADGTEHYFSKYVSLYDPDPKCYCYDVNGNKIYESDPGYKTVYHDEDGLGLKIEVSATGYTLMEDNGVAVGSQKNPDTYAAYKHFNSAGYLDRIVDSNGNKRVFTLDSNNRVTSISLVPKGFSSITQLTFKYNSQNMLWSITNSINGDTVTFYYSDTTNGAMNVFRSGYLRMIEYYSPCGCDNPSDDCNTTKTVKLTYDGNGYLSSVTDEASKYRLTYSYTNGKVTSITEAAAEGTGSYGDGQTIGIEYQDGQTVYYSAGKDGIFQSPAQSSATDDIKTVFVFDNSGRTITSYSTDRATGKSIFGANSIDYTSDTEGAKKNRIASGLNVGSSPVNYLCNPGFEAGSTTYWSTNRGTADLDYHYSHSGNYCAYLPPKQSNTRTYMNQHYVLEKGTYTLSGYVRTTADTGVNTFLRVFIQDSQGSSAVGSSEAVTYLTSLDYADDWVRISCTFNVPTDGRTYYIEICNDGTSGVYYDDLMLEKASGAGNMSYASSGSFAYAGYWTYAGRNTSSIPSSVGNDQCIALNGTPNGISYAKQQIKFGYSAGNNTEKYSISDNDVLILSGWAKADSVPTDDDALFELYAEVHYIDDATAPEAFVIPFNWQTNEWQFVSGLITHKAGYYVDYIDLYCRYGKNANTAYFDSVSLVISPNAGTSYSYDNFGRLTNVKSSNGVDSKSYTYTDSKVTGSASNKISSTTDYYDNGNVRKVTRKLRSDSGYGYVVNTTTEYEYNLRGLITSVITHAENDLTSIYKKTYTYSETSASFGAPTMESDAGSGASIKYKYDSKGNLITTVSPNDYGIDYTYDNFGNITSVGIKKYTNISSGTTVAGSPEIGYFYDSKDRLSKITTESAVYTFTYDAFGNTTGIKVNGVSLASYGYQDNTGKLTSLTYGNGRTVSYTYDNLDRISEICYNSVKVCTYSYNAEGNISEVVDYKSHQKVKYEYDSYGRNNRTFFYTFTGTNANSCVISYAVRVEYDSLGRVFRICYNYSDITAGEDFLYYTPVYVGTSSVISKWEINAGDGSYLRLGYDRYGRTTAADILVSNEALLTTSYNYETVDSANSVYDSESEGYVTQQINTGRVSAYHVTYRKKVPTGTNTSKEIGTNYSYSYDVSGNITDIYKTYTTRNFKGTTFTASTTQTYRTHYTYDYLNQLIREDDEEAGFSYTYSYDSSGNRISKTKYAYTLGTLGGTLDEYTYTYASTGWGDILKYDNKTNDEISYDNIGNPIRIEDNSSDYYTVLSWRGRQLLSIEEYTTEGENTYSYAYTYNSDGIRISKTNGAIRWEYDLDGTTIIRARYYNYNTLQKIILFAYDNNGLPHAMKVTDASSGSGKWYYYEKNLQGDIVGIMNADGYKVVSYSYDAWGVPYAPVYSTDSVVSAADKANAELNPFRYRGYYYDSETGYYYLQTRYYNPEWGRFINADSLINQSSPLGYNLFAYCLNNPINMSDSTGHMPFFLVTATIGAVVGAIAGGIIAANNGGNVWAGIGIGAAAGALAGTGVGMAAGAALAGSITATTGAVIAGGSALATTVSAGGLGAGATYIANNLYQAVNNLEPAAQAATSKMQDVAAKGKAGEALSGIVKNTVHIPSLTGTASYRIPDGLDECMKILSEVKNYSGILSYTNQLKDFVMWSQANGYQMRLYTNAELSGPLQQLVDNGIIQLFPLG